jgi:hypothetical protein
LVVASKNLYKGVAPLELLDEGRNDPVREGPNTLTTRTLSESARLLRDDPASLLCFNAGSMAETALKMTGKRR